MQANFQIWQVKFPSQRTQRRNLQSIWNTTILILSRNIPHALSDLVVLLYTSLEVIDTNLLKFSLWRTINQVLLYGFSQLDQTQNRNIWNSSIKYIVESNILFPETRAIARARAGTHASKFTCAIYCTHEIIVFSCKEKFFIEGFSIEHNYKIL